MTPKILKWVLVAAIIIVLNLFFNYTAALVYDEPLQDTFCKREQVTIPPETQEQCLATGGGWTATTSYDKENFYKSQSVVRPAPAGDLKAPEGYCDLDYTCRQSLESATKVYNRDIFVILVVAGIISLLIGFFIKYQVVSIGLSLGGILSLIIASMRYWSYMDDWLRVAVLAVALCILIWLGIKKIRE